MQLAKVALAKRRNLFDIIRVLPRQGLGQKVSRKTWEDNSFWTIERVKISLDGRHGKAHGLLTWRGTPAEKPTRINGPLKHVWRSIPESEGVIGWQNVKKPPMLLKSVETKVEGAPQ